MKMSLEQEARQVLKQLIDHGHPAYFVGGYVRDRVLEKQIKDIDIATSALPADVIEIFPHTAATGLQHGTVTVITERYSYEVTTFRRESEYERHRRPKQVEFIPDLYEDLRRRDFTINAMALDIDGNIIDPFEGTADLNRRVLRCVGDPVERFNEDALRMMRCIRFASDYGLTVETRTWQALTVHAPLLQHIAMERIRSEWEKMMAGRFPHRAIELLVKSRLLQYLKSEISLPIVHWTSAPPSLLSGLPNAIDEKARWAFLLLYMDVEAEQAEKALTALAFSRKKTDELSKLVAFHRWINEMLRNIEDGMLKLQNGFKQGAVMHGKTLAGDWLTLPLSEISDRYRPLQLHGGEWLDELPIDHVSQLAVSGGDLLKVSAKRPGPWVGNVLTRLLMDVAFHQIENAKQPLLEKANIYISELSGND